MTEDFNEHNNTTLWYRNLHNRPRHHNSGKFNKKEFDKMVKINIDAKKKLPSFLRGD